MFTGNFIDGLIAAVERAEKRSPGVEVMRIGQTESPMETHLEPQIEPWIAAAQQNPAGDSTQLLWQESGVA
jgi:hypothetical protein